MKTLSREHHSLLTLLCVTGAQKVTYQKLLWLIRKYKIRMKTLFRKHCRLLSLCVRDAKRLLCLFHKYWIRMKILPMNTLAHWHFSVSVMHKRLLCLSPIYKARMKTLSREHHSLLTLMCATGIQKVMYKWLLCLICKYKIRMKTLFRKHYRLLSLFIRDAKRLICLFHKYRIRMKILPMNTLAYWANVSVTYKRHLWLSPKY
jgi:hypothetical protein